MQRRIKIRRWLLPLALLVAFTVAVPPAGMGQSSGGYALPRGGYSAPATRRPSVSGSSGYSRPGASSGGYSGPSFGGDRAISRGSSSAALRQYRAPPPPAAAANDYSFYGDQATRRPSTGWGGDSLWGGGRSRTPPSPTAAYGWAQPGRSFGVWDGVMLWGLLNSLSSPSTTRFFQDNRDDPGYRQWRAEADQSARQDPQLRQRLAALDQQIAQTAPGSTSSGKPPPLPDAPPPRRGGGSLVYILLFLGVAAFVLLWIWRRRQAAGGAAGVPAALRGSTASRFRIGMTFPIDPAPFVLVAGATKLRPPEGGMVSVEAIGVLMDGAVAINRLYLPGRETFFQLHLGADGRPDECRYFSRLDEVTPANQEEWGAWLDPAQGMIGWSQFQTKDGKLYDRVWAPGSQRIAPREMTETIQDLSGTTTRKLSAMLYGATPEYVLVAAVDAAAEAFVEVHVGIDINPASFSLPSVPL